jgi:hypothetical protein
MFVPQLAQSRGHFASIFDKAPFPFGTAIILPRSNSSSQADTVVVATQLPMTSVSAPPASQQE